MRVSNSFAEIVRRTAFQGYRYDGQSRRIDCVYELDSNQTKKLTDLALFTYGYGDYREAYRAIAAVVASADDSDAVSVNELSLLNLEAGTLVTVCFRDGSQIALLYDADANFFVLSDTAGTLRRADSMKLLMLNFRRGDRIVAVIRRNGVPYPDAHTCYTSDEVSEIRVIYVSPYAPMSVSASLALDNVTEGSDVVYSNGARINGIFDSSVLTDQPSDALYRLDLSKMEYTINPLFQPQSADNEKVMVMLASAAEIVSGTNLRLLRTLSPGRLELSRIRRSVCLRISEKLKVSLSPCKL